MRCISEYGYSGAATVTHTYFGAQTIDATLHTIYPDLHLFALGLAFVAPPTTTMTTTSASTSSSRNQATTTSTSTEDNYPTAPHPELTTQSKTNSAGTSVADEAHVMVRAISAAIFLLCVV